MATSLKDKRLYETHLQKCGLVAKIIGYNNANDITVELSDGTEITGKTYRSFISGSIDPTNKNQYMKTRDENAKKRIGEIRMMNCKMEAKITEYISSSDITVEFADGTVVEHKMYQSFKNGQIRHPKLSRCQSQIDTSRVGETHKQICGLNATIIEYPNSKHMTVQFEDGTIATNKNYSEFIKGKLAHPNICMKNKTHTKTDRIGETRRMNCGMDATIIDYKRQNKVTVQFEDGTIVTNKCYHNFLEGGINHPKMDPHKRSIKTYRVGEIQKQTCGLDATIVKYTGIHGVTVIFPDGTIVADKDYDSFLKGHISHPTIFKRFGTTIGEIYKNCESKIYHTQIHGVAHRDNTGTVYYYYAHCPICGAHAIWSFDTIKKHECNRELVKERDALITKLTSETNKNIA